MSKKTSLLLALFAMLWFVLGGLCGFFAAKGIYDQPLQESVTRDTTTTIDTIPDIAPEPKDSTPVRTVIRWLPMKLPKKSGADKESVDNPYPASTDTISQWQYFGISEQPQDSALVEIPITSKHYSSEQYDAWISGYEASLDSIKVYSKETLITERVVVSKPPNRLSLDVEAGADYMTQAKDMATFAFGDLTYKIRDSRFAVGLRGGVVKMPTDKSQMFVGGVIKLRIF
jgi:hypothetical protein